MDNRQQHPDNLEALFRQLPEKELPAAFRFNVMQQIRQEAARQQKRNERIGILLAALASAFMAALAVLALFYIDLPRVHFPRVSFDPASLSFYLYISALTLLLLGADHILRRAFHKDEQK